jgi:hypothetical protein
VGAVPPPAPAVLSKPVARLKVRALYLTGWTVGIDANLRHYIDLARRTEINAYVVDVKDDDGYVGYRCDIPKVTELKAVKKKYNADKVISAFHENGVHVIGRVACFKDPVASANAPEWALHDAAGQVWHDDKRRSWLDPYNEHTWAYLVAVARDALARGFDEIQFDYVRFPSDGNVKHIVYSDTVFEKYEAIAGFLAYARRQLPGAVLSADVFGIVCESEGDTEKIGQYLELVGCDVDYLSPMVYPSHYALGQVINQSKFPAPDLKPYEVVYQTLLRARERIAVVGEYHAGLRPYLQDFTASWLGKDRYQPYGIQQVRAQIKAVYDAGYEEWIFWNASNRYSEGAFEPEAAAPPLAKR